MLRGAGQARRESPNSSTSITDSHLPEDTVLKFVNAKLDTRREVSTDTTTGRVLELLKEAEGVVFGTWTRKVLSRVNVEADSDLPGVFPLVQEHLLCTSAAKLPPSAKQFSHAADCTETNTVLFATRISGVNIYPWGRRRAFLIFCPTKPGLCLDICCKRKHLPLCTNNDFFGAWL